MHFDSDYMNLCHPSILTRMAELGELPFNGYGTDQLTATARQQICRLCRCPEAKVFFLAGGTQTNMVTIDALLRSFEGILAADSGHISIHESGAIEFTGHKVLPLRPDNGKITARQVDDYVTSYYNDPNWEHIVPPGMVYITHPTEYGTLYSLEELEELSAACRRHHIPLYLDGARMGYGLAADNADVTLCDIARLCDAFYIGGTKCGTMYGEAVVFPDPRKADRFFSHIKRHGALLAKGWAVALQFDTLMRSADNPAVYADDIDGTLYYTICRHAVVQAMRIRKALLQKGYTMYLDSPTNQQFTTVTLQQAERLGHHLTYGQWEPPCGNSVTIRFATSWATDSHDVDKLIELL